MKRPAMRRPLYHLATAAAFAALAACGGADTPESTTPASPEPVDSNAEAVATGPDALEQAERGAAVYEASCGFCHGDAGEGAGNNPPVVGAGVLGSYANAGDLLTYVMDTMPADDPGGLALDEFQDVVAFMLQANGIDLIGKSVTPDSAGAITF
jgi:mono/diheme cytochrome c family protein